MGTGRRISRGGVMRRALTVVLLAVVGCSSSTAETTSTVGGEAAAQPTTISEPIDLAVKPVREAAQVGGVFIGPDGLPVFSELSSAVADPPQAIVIRKCLDPGCSALSDPVIFGEWLAGAAMAVGPSGIPVFAFTDLEVTDRPGDFTFVICQTADCAESTSPTFGRGGVGLLALDSSALPVVLEENPGGGGFLLIRCADIACNQIASRAVIPAPEAVDAESLVIGADDRPVILYVTIEERVEMYVARCDDPLCAEMTVNLVATDALTVPPGTAEVDQGTFFKHSLTLDSRGVPIVAFGSDQLQVARCEDPGCSGEHTVARVEESLRIGSIDLVYSRSGLPIIGYAVLTSQHTSEVRLASCADPFCEAGTIVTVRGLDSPSVSMSVLPDGNPVLVSGGDIVTCGDPECSDQVVSQASWDQTPIPTTTLPPLGATTGGWILVPRDPKIFGLAGHVNAVHATTEGLIAGGAVCPDLDTLACQPTVWTSGDGLTWSQTRLGDDGDVNGVTSTLDGLVVVGSSGADPAIWVSGNGTTWTMVATEAEVFRGCSTWDDFPSEEQCDTSVSSVVSDGTIAIAVGKDAGGTVIWRSQDPAEWERVASSDQDEALAGEVWIDRLYSLPSGFVALGGYCEGDSEVFACGVAVWASADATTWTRVPDPGSLFIGEAYSTFFPSGATRWNDELLMFVVACDAEGHCPVRAFVTSDGIDWSPYPLDPEVFGEQGPTAVTSLGSGLVAVGAQYDPFGDWVTNVMWATDDGITWKLFELDPTVFPEFSGIGDAVEFRRRLVGVGGLGRDGPAIWIYDPSLDSR